MSSEKDWRESPEAIAAVDALFASVGLEHGRRATRTGAWNEGQRVRRPKAAAPQVKAVGKRTRREIRPGVIQPAGWEKYSWLKAGFSTRQGGGSKAYGAAEQGEQNLGWNGADQPAVVASNRERFLRAIGGPEHGELITVRQFHSGLVRVLEREDGPFATADGRPVLRGDALMSSEPGVLLGILTADCVPVLVADVRRRAVAAFHAGWRGTLARIVERGIGTMQIQYGSKPKDLVAAIGPAIGGCCYSVGEEIRFDFDSQFAYARELFSEVYDSDPVRDKYPLLFLTARAPGHSNIGPQIHLDLMEANRRQLLDAGVSEAKISVVGECTACTREKNGRRRYFSHRGEHGFTGRMLSVVGIV